MTTPNSLTRLSEATTNVRETSLKGHPHWLSLHFTMDCLRRKWIRYTGLASKSTNVVLGINVDHSGKVSSYPIAPQNQSCRIKQGSPPSISLRYPRRVWKLHPSLKLSKGKLQVATGKSFHRYHHRLGYPIAPQNQSQHISKARQLLTNKEGHVL